MRTRGFCKSDEVLQERNAYIPAREYNEIFGISAIFEVYHVLVCFDIGAALERWL